VVVALVQVALIQAGTGKIEEELKNLSAAFTEKTQTLATLKRKKGGSLMTAGLEEVLTEEVVRVRPTAQPARWGQRSRARRSDR
jgi:hypothetical protein